MTNFYLNQAVIPTDPIHPSLSDLDNGQNDKVQDEKESRDDQYRMNLFELAFEEFYYAVEDKSGGNPIRNAITEGHEDTGKEGGDCFIQIIPADLLEGGHHHNPNHY